MKSILLAMVVVFGLLVGRLAAVNDSLQNNLNKALNTVATEIAHHCIDHGDQHIVGKITVEPLGGTQYRAHGTANNGIADSKPWIVHWTFTFDLNLPAVSTDAVIETTAEATNSQ